MMINVIFDIDGVLIDVRRSFHDSIKYTVTYYLEECLNIPVRRHAISEQDIQAFKAIGGFNDDWDLTAAVLYYFVSLLPEMDVAVDLSSNNILQVKNSLQKQVHVKRDIFAKANIPGFVKRVRKPGLEGVLKATGGRNKDLVVYEGDVLKTNLVKRIFQELYWGVDKFSGVYDAKPLFNKKPGKVHKEILIIDESVLRSLAEREDTVLSIITGREKIDAEYSLEKYDIRKYFEHIITLSDLEDLSQRKPDPYGLFCINDKVGAKHEVEKNYYIGDQIDDINMVKTAKKKLNVESVGYVYSIKDIKQKKLMHSYQPDHVIYNHRDLLDII